MEAGSTSGQTRSQPEQEGLLPPGAWDVVADESVVGFQVKKLGLYFVKGRFPTTFEIRGQRRPVELTGHAHPDEHERHVRMHLTGTFQLENFGIRPLPPVRLIVGDDVHLDAQLVLERAG